MSTRPHHARSRDGLVAVLAGATGLVGGECLKQLVADHRYARVVVVTRRDAGPAARHAKVEQVVSEFDRLDAVRDRLRDGDHAYCALGTTIRKAGSQARFRAVDHDYVLRFAEAARAGGATHLSVVSALGASRASPFPYSRVKGETEEDLRRMGWPSLAILRPSVIAGARAESRPLERLGEHVLRWAPAKWRPVAATDIAAAMIALAHESEGGVTVVESREIARCRV
ncbi:MAG: oxidoreductase [Lysobacterales bacterium]|nr:MAG: oxidoreductase [Xanthomonadales bacterium]